MALAIGCMHGMSETEAKAKTRRIALARGAWLDHYPGAFAETNANWMASLADELAWHEESYSMFGRTVVAPRLVSWHGDADASYRYSGVVHTPEPWTEELTAVREAVQEVSGLAFNAVLANWYRSGSDSMGWHADRERELGPAANDRQIASLSLGGHRRFLLRNEETREIHEFVLGAGDLLVMRGVTQELYKHSIPKTVKAMAPRINLSFRCVVPSKG
jgi:alkylated DNA repair dioxygenase AlkB